MAEQSGVGAFSWSPVFQQALWSARELFIQSAASGGLATAVRREYVAAALGHAVLERRLPVVHDLPLQELLEIRQKRKDGLGSLRVALRALATQVDVSRPISEIQQAALDVIAEKVDPAVDEVRRSLRAARLDALKKLGRSSVSLAGATFSASVMLAAGAPLDLAALLATLGGVLGAVAESVIDRERLLRGSQWGLLVRFGTGPRKRWVGCFQAVH